MQHADFIHYVRLAEYASADNPDRYRRQVAMFSALGYAWIAGCLIAALAVMAWAIPQLMAGRVRGGTIFLLLGALGLAWTSVRALWVSLDEAPRGIRLTKAEAPALFKTLSKIRKQVKGPRLDEVYLDDQFNASITQLPRRGLFGGHVNRLHLGLPLVMALDAPRLTAVLAHEYGHLRGGHGRFAAWVYRTRMSWARLGEQLDGEGSVAAWLTGFFMRWYVPRYLAKTFALARQDEYEADHIAARMVGSHTAGAALIELEVKGRWLQGQFWRQHWRGAAQSALPQGPFKALRHLLVMPPDEKQAQHALREALKEISNVDDTHPVLRDRLEALDVHATSPHWSSHGALPLLGKQAEAFIQQLDQQWCREHASDWKAEHQRLQRLLEKVKGWRQRGDDVGVEELVMWADAERQLAANAPVSDLYERALARQPGHTGALLGLLDVHAHAPDETRLAWLEALWQGGSNAQLWAAQEASAIWERSLNGSIPEALKTWRQRVKDAQATAEAVLEALCTPPWLDGLSRHDLNEADLDGVIALLRQAQPVRRAWLTRCQIAGHPRRQAYRLYLELAKLDDAQQTALCRALEQQLDLPGPVLALAVGGDQLKRKDVERQAFDPVFVR